MKSYIEAHYENVSISFARKHCEIVMLWVPVRLCTIMFNQFNVNLVCIKLYTCNETAHPFTVIYTQKTFMRASVSKLCANKKQYSRCWHLRSTALSILRKMQIKIKQKAIVSIHELCLHVALCIENFTGYGIEMSTVHFPFVSVILVKELEPHVFYNGSLVEIRSFFIIALQSIFNTINWYSFLIATVQFLMFYKTS